MILARPEWFASALQTYAEGKVFGIGFDRWAQGYELRPIFERIATGQALSLETGGMRLIHWYLISKHGMGTYKRFIHLWSNENAAKDLLLKSGYNADEAMAVLLSYVSNENLAPLFQFAGLQVFPERIDAGYQLTAGLIAIEPR